MNRDTYIFVVDIRADFNVETAVENYFTLKFIIFSFDK